MRPSWEKIEAIIVSGDMVSLGGICSKIVRQYHFCPNGHPESEDRLHHLIGIASRANNFLATDTILDKARSHDLDVERIVVGDTLQDTFNSPFLHAVQKDFHQVVSSLSPACPASLVMDAIDAAIDHNSARSLLSIIKQQSSGCIDDKTPPIHAVLGRVILGNKQQMMELIAPHCDPVLVLKSFRNDLWAAHPIFEDHQFSSITPNHPRISTEFVTGVDAWIMLLHKHHPEKATDSLVFRVENFLSNPLVRPYAPYFDAALMRTTLADSVVEMPSETSRSHSQSPRSKM